MTCSPTAIQLHGGRYFDLLAPSASDFEWSDIAHGLAYSSRFGGQTSVPWSIAQHSIWVANYLVFLGATRDTVAWGLLHDAHEVLGMADLPSPTRRALGPAMDIYREISHRIDQCLIAAAGLVDLDVDQVRHADMVALQAERRQLMPAAGDWGLPDVGPVPHLRRHAVTGFPDDIKAAYLAYLRNQTTAVVAGAPAEVKGCV